MLPLVLNRKSEASEWHFTVYRSTFVKVVTYFHSFLSLFFAMMYNKCDVFVCGHKWKCNSNEMDSLFSFHLYYRALHPYVPFHFLYIISVCWCYTVSWMQDRYCTKLYCYWLKMLIKSCLRSLKVDLNPTFWMTWNAPLLMLILHQKGRWKNKSHAGDSSCGLWLVSFHVLNLSAQFLAFNSLKGQKCHGS